ncbi:ubiquinone biosynthesis regulatory protein kinase UbiB [Psychrobium sp. 1_MG-2023]|uniref:ubiquinone biosynthesis regulatory protein kinase UbiB n=1 Tax=Psychrobium sp. 1_MG-2023 TaxID=3062624 RepID=UPI000C346E6B|nr:ubiquinone biosynthesis regulatory protein kinase UbiB [Psychrobium sp. 1_MG-2023]MDP2561998.1 ubiquinone biosynthesis regulatory protein kinase UbiB [Psychrobium sp. 1_MG-2023]PKF58620.1 ubiquinone biosynthesis regulatory protein kinase UbiB [Alteromonadales bacterium alter-6D02]
MKFSRLRRFYQLNKVFFQYGLDEFIPWHLLPWYARAGRYCFFWLTNQHQDKSQAERLRLSLEKLGPVYIKFGQMLSTRRDLLTPELAKELSKLQDNVAPFPSEQAIELITRNLEQPIEKVFDHFDSVPLASASIAQVHTATLKETQQQVVIKVIRPEITNIIKSDTDLMATFAKLLTKVLPQHSERLRPVEVVEEYRRTILNELDMSKEAANTQVLRSNFTNSDSLYIPEIYPEYCFKNMLVIERIFGIPVADIEQLKAQNTDLKLLAERGVEVFFTQVFRDSFFHADMHPGNIFVSKETPHNPKYIGIDCGIVGTLNKEDQRYLAENFAAFFNRDYHKVATLHVDSGWVPSDTNVEEFEFAIRHVLEPIFAKPLAEISFGHVLINLFDTARQFNMQVQPQLVLLQKTLLYIEGLGRQLYPELDLWQTAKPFLERWLKEQMGPQAFYQAVKANGPFWLEKMPELPNLVYDSLKRQQKQQAQWQKNQQRLLRNQHLQQRSQFFLIIGSCLLLSSTLLYLHDKSDGLLLATSIGSIFCWFKAWQDKSSYTD